MLWFLYFVLVFGVGLGMWEFIAIRDRVRRQGSAALELAKAAGTPMYMAYSGLPRALRWPLVRGWILVGQLGFIIVAVGGWWTAGGLVGGSLHAIELEVLSIIVGCAIGWGISQAVGG